MNNKLHALVAIFVESHRIDDVLQAISNATNVEKIYEVTGEFDIVTQVSAEDIENFRDIIKSIMKITGVKSTVSSFILASHKHSYENKRNSRQKSRNRKAASASPVKNHKD